MDRDVTSGETPSAAERQARRRARGFPRVPMRFILPNLVTLLALCLGLTSIRFAVEGRFELSVLCIAAAAVLDGLDGRLARALNGASRFGAELDSLADFVDFGVAPALLLYFWGLNEIRSLGWFAALVYAVACAIRLARFNVAIDDPNKPAWAGQFFVGMPSPAGAIVALLPVYLNLSALAVPNVRASAFVEALYMLLIAFLMASHVPHLSGKQIGRVKRELLPLVMLGAVAFVLLLATFPMEVLLAISLIYLAHIPWAVRRHAELTRRDAEAAAAAQAARDEAAQTPPGA